MLQGLYVITDPVLTPPNQLETRVQSALKGGAKIVQFRDKTHSARQRQTQAQMLRQLTHRFGACLIINDDVELCQMVAADGVHLGQDDLSVSEARQRLGEQFIIGATCHGSIALAAAAEAAGADYLAFGRFFPSATKPGAPPASLDDIAPFLQTTTRPCVAIGGITLNNAPTMISAGFSMVAVVHDIFGQPNIAHRCRQYQTLFANRPHQQEAP